MLRDESHGQRARRGEERDARGYRSCIACNQCPQVCPVELQPQLIMKSLLANDVEDAIHQGFLDCTDCGLCTYVCPSKIELDSISRDAKDKLVKELAS